MKGDSQTASSSSMPLHPSLPKKPPAITGIAGADLAPPKQKVPKSKANASNIVLGKKPTLEELMRNNEKMKSGILAKR